MIKIINARKKFEKIVASVIVYALARNYNCGPVFTGLGVGVDRLPYFFACLLSKSVSTTIQTLSACASMIVYIQTHALTSPHRSKRLNPSSLLCSYLA